MKMNQLTLIYENRNRKEKTKEFILRETNGEESGI